MSISQIQIKSFEHLLAKRQQIINNNTLPVGLPDAAVYYYLKEASFLSKKQQRWTFYLFQGINTNPQNLSIFMRDEAQKQNKSGNKQKLSKGIFAVYDLFGKADIIIEISIPGNLRIFKHLQGKKELVSSEEIDLMYLSSVFRAMYQNNLPWGRYYLLFHQSKNYYQELNNFYKIAFQVLLKKDINIPGQFQSQARVKGSHGCSLIFNYMKERKLVRHSIEIIEELIKANQQFRNCFKFRILLAQLYEQFGKTSKSLDQVNVLLEKPNKQPYLRYYQAKYLYASSLYQQALAIANSIVQYNQFQIWILLAKLHHELKNFGDLLICLNHAIKFSKIKGGNKNLQQAYRPFQQLGKIKYLGVLQSIENNPKVLIYIDSPSNIPAKEIQEKNKFLIEKGFWRLNPNQKLAYEIMQDLRYRLQSKKFEELLQRTFEDNIPKFQVTSIRKGLTSLHSQDHNTQKLTHQHSSFNRKQEAEEDLPQFLKESVDKVDQSVNMKAGRNLSIIPEIQSVIQNSNYQQKQKERNDRHVTYKREVQQGLFKIVQLLLSQTQFQKAEYQNNVGKILQVYNKMRTSSKYNNYYADRMFKIFVQVQNYRSIIVLMAETLDFMQQKGVRKIDKLPYWMHKYLFFIIEQKGLKYLNDMLQKLNFYDQAVIDTIQIAKNWKMKGVTY